MGQIFHKEPNKLLKNDFLIEMNKVEFRGFFDSLDIIDQFHPQQLYYINRIRSVLLKFEEFEDIFSGLTQMYREVFLMLSDESELVNTFEALACFTIFSGESYETKCSIIFRLFDFDVSNTLDCQEISRTIPCVCRALCKITGLPCPSNIVLLKLAAVCFQMMDADNNHNVDFEEFYTWTVENDELQKFLLTYTGTQTYVYAQKRMGKMTQDIEEQFIAECSKYQNNSLSAKHLLEFLPNICPEKQITFLFTIIVEYSIRIKTLSQSEKQSQKLNPQLWEWKSDSDQKNKVLENLMIKRFDFLDIMKAWLSFSIVDYRDNSQIPCKEMKNLIWVYEEEEPDYFKVNQLNQEMDLTRSGLITREQWMNQLCSEDKMFKRVLYNSQIKKIFDKYDEDKDGFVQSTQIREILKDLFKEQLRKIKDMRSVESFNNILDSLVVDISKELKTQDLIEFNWFQFHQLIANSTAKYPSLSKLLKTNQ